METKLAYGRAELDRSALDTGGDGPLSFVASSTGLNRYGYSLRNEGWQLENFNANPVVLWMHQPHRPPIARGVALSKNGAVVLDQVVFDAEDELARMVESKYRRGFLSAVSVGFDFTDDEGKPLENWWRLSLEEIRDEAHYDLAEVSAVSIPADPRALVQHSRRALSLVGRELVELFDEQEYGTTTAEQVRACVRDELARLGLQLPPAGTTTDPTGKQAGTDEIDTQAASAVLAAFATEEGISL
ncbi:HK97 family phage prohead protease [Saccharothrix sp. AJ9571]|nr:HK97 family phage prohead protease [Saccharothrix sp. AJ9571]